MICARLPKFCRQRLCIGAAFLTAIRCRAPWRASIRDEHASLLQNGYQAFAGVFCRQLQLVATSIEHDELGGRARTVQQSQNVVKLQTLIPECGRAWLLCVDWDQVVDVGVLLRRAMPRVVEEADSAGACCVEPADQFSYPAEDRAAPGVFDWR